MAAIDPSLPNWMGAGLAPFIEQFRNDNGQPVLAIHEARFESRYFSSIIHFHAEFSDETVQRFVAKFPKVSTKRGHSVLPPRTTGDLALALREHSALTFLARTWKGSHTRFQTPAFWSPDVGVLVFSYIQGKDLWSRDLAYQALTGRSFKSEWLGVIRNLGNELATYHVSNGSRGNFDINIAENKLRRNASRLDLPLGTPLSRNATEAHLVPGIKGFEIRNGRMKQSELRLFDPGHIKQEPAEGDVARFLFSVRMLAWGTAIFPLPIQTREIEAAFLDSYTSVREISFELLNHFMKREAVKNWLAGIELTRQKRLPGMIGRALESLYVSGGYRRLWTALERGAQVSSTGQMPAR